MKKIFKTMFLCLVAVFAVNANAISSSDKFDGEYSIDYLLRNYDVVTLGMNHVYDIDNLSNYINPGEVKGISNINGSVLINGRLKGSTYLANNYNNPNPAPSYIKKVTSVTTFGSDYDYRSDIYLGTGNTSYNNPNNFSVAETDDYIDFEKLYYSILNQQSEMRADVDDQKGIEHMTEKLGYNFILNSGTHVFDLGLFDYLTHQWSYSWRKRLYIESNENNYVIVNIDDVVVDYFPEVYVNDSHDLNYNVIFNFPNARCISIETNFNDFNKPFHIVAPKADVVFVGENNVYGTVIANSIWYANSISGANLNIDSQHLSYDGGLYNSNISDAKFGVEDTNEDLYVGDYSIDELLRNYSLVAFGKNTNTPVDIYHIVGNFLIDGDLGKRGRKYSKSIDPNCIAYVDKWGGCYAQWSYMSFIDMTNLGMRLDLNGKNRKYNSYITGTTNTNFYLTDSLMEREFLNWESNTYVYPDFVPSDLYFNIDNASDYFSGNYNVFLKQIDWWDLSLVSINEYPYITDNYVDFEYLYNNVIEKQALIKQGDKLTKNANNEIIVETGGYYNIDSVSDLSKIVFNNFRNNKNKITVITINQSGEVVMPYQETDYANNIYTNDFYGKNTQMYYYDEILPEYYYGNIVFNFPNATKVTFAEDNSFKGHIIAPKAAIEMPEMNLAGCVIADSISAAGYSELHYYPLALGDLIYEDPPEEEEEVPPAYAEIKGTLVWADEDDKDAIRPAYVVVHFYADGVEIASKKVYEADNWQFSLEVPIDKEGKVTYTIDNDDVSGYVFDYNETSKYNYEITVSHKIKGVKAEVENPKTGAFNILLLFIPLIGLIGGYIYLSKKTVYKQI